MKWLYVLAALLLAAVVLQANRRENLTMLSENKVVDAWGNVTLTP
jgi:hypothetical protein